MADPRLIEELTREVLTRLSPEKFWEMATGCRTVSIEKEGELVRYIVECGAQRIGISAEDTPAHSDLAKYIDHTLLKADATHEEIVKLCNEAREFGFATVCINPTWVRLAADVLKGSLVGVCTVAGFPLGATLPDVKAYEARRVIFDGATEVDMVINIGALKGGDDDLVREDIRQVVTACHEQGVACKVIIETAYLNRDEKIRACQRAQEAGADFVKTSTGFGPGGATPEDVALMSQVVGPGIGVKAAGGIRDLSTTRQMLQAGATRIGASAGVKIVQDQPAEAGARY